MNKNNQASDRFDSAISGPLRERYDRLSNIIDEAGGALAAFSGGVDSTLLLKVCSERIPSKLLAVTASSAIYPAGEIEGAVSLAKEFGVEHVVIRTDELRIPGFKENPPDRCYICKSALFSRLLDMAKERGIPWVFDGSNADDVGDYRPGRRAAKELGIRSPMEEAGLTKEDVRALAKALGLSNWNKPAMACLASRFPYGFEIAEDALRRVEKAERILRESGFRTSVRVRHHEDIARIEIGGEDFPRLLDQSVRTEIVTRFKALGYLYVTADLAGYRTGSMNETLGKERSSPE